MKHAFPRLLGIALASILVWSCGMRRKVIEQRIETEGGAEALFIGERKTDPADVLHDTAFGMEAVAWGLTYPTSVVLDDVGRIYVVEAGYAYGVEPGMGRILRLDSGNKHVEIARGPGAPWTGATFHRGSFYVSAGGKPARILRISLQGQIDTLVGGLPPMADHHTNRPVVGPDGYVYFPQGTVTNSGVVGPDNVLFGWMKDDPGLHDIPARDIVLAGRNFTDEDLLTANPADKITTGAYVPYGTRTEIGQRIPGRLPATGAIMRLPLGGGPLELVAWGLRNPFGLAFAPDGRLYATENGFDMRGSRSIANGPDVLWRIESGTWYGWPDFAAGIPVTDPRFKPKDGPQPEFVLAEHPQTSPKPVADLGVHTVAGGLDFSRSEKFGFMGHAFITQFGDMTP